MHRQTEQYGKDGNGEDANTHLHNYIDTYVIDAVDANGLITKLERISIRSDKYSNIYITLAAIKSERRKRLAPWTM